MTSVTSNLKRLLESSTPLPITSEELARFWDYVDKKYYDPDEGTWQDRYDYGVCTLLNSSPTLLLREAGHSVQIFGGDEEALKNSGLATRYRYQGGHDWLLVDGRWIIDQWAAAYLGVTGSIHDLQDPGVASLYPPRSTWKELGTSPEHRSYFEKWFKRAAKDWVDLKKRDCQ